MLPPTTRFVESLRPKTGLDPEVVAYLKAQPGYDIFYGKLLDFVAYLLPEYQKDDQSLVNTDIVLWLTIGHHHVTATEDFPVLSLTTAPIPG
jgi:UPF0042 nucleotide-binding protein